MTNFYPPRRPRSAESMKQLVLDAGRLFGNKDYLVYKKGDLTVKLSFAGFSERVFALCRAFSEAGLAGEAVAVIGETSPEWIATYAATVITGGVIVPLDKELAPKEIANFINRVKCRAVVFSSKTAQFFSDRSEFPYTEKFIVFGESETACAIDAINFDTLIERGRCLISEGGDTFDYPTDLEKTCAVIFTSGTTGSSKGVMLSERSLVAAINSSYNMTSFTEKDVIVSVLPIHHTYEMTCGILTPLIIGCTVCINDSLKHVLRSFQTYKPTGLVLVPLFVSTIYKKIWDTAKKGNKDKLLRGSMTFSGYLRKVGIDTRKLLFKDVRKAFGGNIVRIICGGAPMNPDWVKEFDSFGIALCQGYGITECAPLISVCPECANRAGSAGLPVPGLEVRVEKDDPDAEYGEICVKGPNVMNGYFEDREATEKVLTKDGWFKTGDLGYIDGDGFVYLTGRKKNVIVLNNGKNVFPEEIEEYLGKIDLISECAVIGRKKDEDEDITVTAIIFPDYPLAAERGMMTAESVGEKIKSEIASLNRTLPTFKQIRGIEIRRTEFDKTTSHKIKRYKIK